MKSMFFLSLFLFITPAIFAATAFPKILDETAMKNADPCDDFYQYACGTWLDQTLIPGNKKAVYRQSTPLEEATDVTLNSILEKYARGDFSNPATYSKKLADYYLSCMNADQNAAAMRESLHAQTLKINALDSDADLARVVAELQMQNVPALFTFYPAQSLRDSTKVIGFYAQGGYGLGERDYYLDQDKKSVQIRNKYRQYISDMLVAMGRPKTETNAIAASVLRIETYLAKVSYSAADSGDPSKTNHPLTLTDLKKLTPQFDWSTYANSLQQSGDSINVDEPEFFAGLQQLLTHTSKTDLKNYLKWQVANRSADKIPGIFEKLHFGFWNTFLNGTKSRLPRWQICTQAVANSMGYALAEAYVKTFDGKAIKTQTESLIANIKEAFVSDLNQLVTGADAWIDNKTVREALLKVQNLAQKVGAPEVWRNYDLLPTSSENYLQNSLNVSLFENRRNLAKIGKPVVKTDWDMMPWEVNAYYDRSNNEFVFPFGILQPPSLDLTASEGANLGSFGGGTIGHELTHGFDSSGSQYDSRGNVKNWWSPATLDQFEKRAACYADQASQYLIKDTGLKVDGRQTLEENLADQGGVKLGYMALENSLSKRAESPLWLGKFSERQQYWIAYAQSWCAKITPEALRSQMTSDPHPPSEFRVNAVLMNRPEFARDFKCAANSKMAPLLRCSIW